MSYTGDMRYREARATELLGPYTVKTAAGLLVSRIRKEVPGWLYAGSGQLLFLSDAPLSAILGPGRAEVLDEGTLLIEILGRPYRLTAPFVVPNGIIDFGDGLEFAGQKKQIKAIASMAKG